MATMLGAANAQALEEFPAVIQKATGSPCPPPCIVCHPTNSPTSLADAPMLGTGTRPFFEQLFALGFMPFNEMQLNASLQAYAALADGAVGADVTNGTGNGVHDMVDLADGTNPNDGSPLCIGPKYGCGASRIEPKGDLDDYGTFLAAFAAMALLFRVRRRPPR
jgi:hypothetical protein